MEMGEVAEMLGYKEWSPQRLRLADLLFVRNIESIEVKGPLGLWPFPALNTFLYNIRLLTKTVKR
ncbi:MAG: hypothetical protein QXL77_08450 [Candidatus Bathyarchaeia archaeon]